MLPVKSNRLSATVLDLFCGAGGMALGFKRAGFQCVGAFDVWETAVETFNAHVGSHAKTASIEPNLELPDATVIVGGPPCQGFSSAGMRRSDDNRNSLVSVFANIIAARRPQAFVFENVEGFLTASDGRFVKDLLEPLLAAGYRIHLRKINAANYGVPQHRKRVLAIGGLGWEPSFPMPSHSAMGAPGSHRATEKLKLAPSVEEALASLPPASTAPPGIPMGHFFDVLKGIDLERARLLEQGQTMRDLPVELWHDSFKKRAFRRVMDGMPTEKRGGAPSGLKRLRADFPSKAITGGALSEFLHPYFDRCLTLRECARLQTFPDDFYFSGTVSNQIQQIGNAVPPLLAESIALNLLKDLTKERPVTNVTGLASFVPTFSEGMSPALRRVVEMVEAHYFGRETRQQEEFELCH